MNFEEMSEFAKELKRLSKKYRSLTGDLDQFRRVVDVVPLGNSKHFNIITKNDRCTIVKARLFCRCLRGSSLRIVYAFYSQTFKIDFIELYCKS